jgi:hypothetical protein
MKLRDLLALFVRVLGLWFIAEGIIQLPALFYVWPADTSKINIEGYTQSLHAALWIFLASDGLRLLCGGIFLLGADRLAALFSPSNSPDVSES